MKHLINKISCYLYGHHFTPMYTIFYGGAVQYECDCCGYTTKRMFKKEHVEFIMKYCPTWGKREDDSQGYKSQTRKQIHRGLI